MISLNASSAPTCFWRSLRSVFLVVMVACHLSACSLSSTLPGQGVQNTLANTPAVSKPAVLTPSAPSMSDKLLAEAEFLFQEGKLLAPDSDNAYIRYRAAQLFDEGNERAQSGLDAILISELGATRDLFASSKYKEAERHLAKLTALFPESSLLKTFISEREAIKRAQAKARAKSTKVARSKKKVRDENRVYLDKGALAKRSPDVVELLSSLAKPLKQTQQGVLIYARNDAEGRWIYKQMRKASPDYRIRGDIRIGEPSVKLLDPFTE